MTDLSMMRNHVLGFGAAALALAAPTTLPSAAVAQANPAKTSSPAAKVQPPPRSVIQKLRAFLGVNPPVAVGGSRSAGGQGICLLSPWPSADRKGESVPVTVVVSRPVLLTVEPLNEIRLEKGKELLWRDRADSVRAIEGPIAWPIRPLQPGEQLTLKVRPRGTSGGDFAVFTLHVADPPVLASTERQAQLLGNDPKAWGQYIEQLNPQQALTAAGLLSSPQAPQALRQSLQCSKP